MQNIQNILPDNADDITNAILTQLTNDNKDDETVYLDTKKPTKSNDTDDKKEKEKQSKDTEKEESDEPQLDFEIYDTDREESDQPDPPPPINTSNKSSINNNKKLENNDTHITTATSSSDDNNHTTINTLDKDKMKIHMDKEEVKNNAFNRKDIITPIVDDNICIKHDEDTKTQEKVSIKDVGSRTMEQWLNRDNLIVHPVWIGNLPRGTTVNQLRHFVESAVGRVLVSIHISVKQPSNNERTYAFLNLPTAEKQLLAVTLLDGKIFTAEKLIVRPKRPSKFPQSFFGSSPISEHFKHFRDCVVPAILANPTINLNVTSVRKILEQNHINIDHLPNRVWCVQCTLVPQCHRTYCSFYHCHQEKELGRIISILAAQNCGDSSTMDGGNNGEVVVGNDPFSIEHKKNLERANNPNTIRSRHTLLIQGLPRSITSKKIEETFEVFGEIDNVIVNPDHTCYVRMKRSQDARKIVHLFKYNHAGVIVDFAPYGASKMGSLMSGGGGKGKDNQNQSKNERQSQNHNQNQNMPSKPGLNNYATAPNHYLQQNKRMAHPNLQNNRSHDGRVNGGNVNVPSLPITNPNNRQFNNAQAQAAQAMNYNYNNQNMSYNYGKSGNPRDSLRLGQTHSEPIPQQYNNQSNLYMSQLQAGQQQAGQVSQVQGVQGQMQAGGQRGGYVNNNNHQFNMMMQQMTPQQYTEYYNQMMQQRYYSQQQQNNMQMNGMNVQGYNTGTQQRYNQFNSMQNNNNNSYGYMNQNSQVFSPTSMNNNVNNPYAFSQHMHYHSAQKNALSPIAQTPNMNQMMNGMSMNTNVTSPPVTSPRVVQQQQAQVPQAVAYGNARQQLLLKGSYSTNDAYAQNNNTPHYQINAQPQAKDDSYHNYQHYQNDFLQQEQRKNMEHLKWMQQTQQTQAQAPPQTQFTYKNVPKHAVQVDEGALPLPNPPQVGPIPEPDLHFQLSALHDFPLSPTSALKDKQ